MSRRWWRDWWSEDFSWASLAAKPVGAQQIGVVLGSVDGSKSLQDYWRRDSSGRLRNDAELVEAGELVRAVNGSLWHVCHVPLEWRDGTAAKSAWDEGSRARLRELIAARLAATAPSRFFDAQKPQGPDGRAQLTGAILCDPPSQPDAGELRIRADFAFLPAWDAGATTFGAAANFRRALFDGRLRLHGATFRGGLSFDDARFMGDVTLGSVVDARAAQFSEEVSARKAIFLGNADFSRCGFARGARFDAAHFAGEVDFFAATLAGSVAFTDAVFDARACFMSAKLESFSFSSVRCRASADFSSAIFGKDCWVFFRNSDFRADANFNGAKFPRKGETLVGGFTGTRFAKSPQFVATGVHWIAALDDVILEQGIELDKLGAPFLQRQFEQRLLPAALKVPKEFEENIPRERLRQLLSLQGGCRALRMAMDRSGNVSLAQTFQDFERRIDEEVRQLPVPDLQDE